MKSLDIIGLFEAHQNLFEVEMSPSNLKKLAGAIPGAKVGMEFEMVVPNVKSGDDEDYEAEEDMDQDERAEDIADIIRFFSSEDEYMGRVNDRRTVEELDEELREMFYDYMSNQVDELWNQDEGKEYFSKWVKENVDPDEVAEFAETPEDLFGEKKPSIEDYDNFIEDQWYTQGSYWDEAYRQFRDEKIEEGDFSERDFLREIGIRDMSDVNNSIRGHISWPFYTQPNYNDGEEIEDVADDFSNAIGKRVYSSTSYHGARRSEDAYSLEPDSSINHDSDEAGLEFISPPMSVDEMLEDLDDVRQWAVSRGCYTNRSTGLHVNVSVPNYSLENLDYVKLAVLMGDKYVLEKFERYGSQWAKSALEIVQEKARNSEDVDRLLSQIKSGVESIASKLIHSGRTDKYTSINTKDNYVEFRSPGGDWLGKNFDKIKDTILRFVVALDAACDPNKYKKEYYKALYKVLKPKDPNSGMSMLAKYMSGTITRSEYAKALEKARKERFKNQGIVILQPEDLDQGDWVVEYDDGMKQDAIYIANTNSVSNEGQAYKAAQKFKPQWFNPDTLQYITVTPFEFDDEIKELNLYRAEYGHKTTGVTAPNEELAREYIRIMDPEWFSVYPQPNSEITLTDENEASKRKIKSFWDFQQNKLKIGREWLERNKIWRASGTPSFPGSGSRIYIAAVTLEEALDVARRLDKEMTEGPRFEIYVSDAYPDADTYEAYQKSQEELIKERQIELANREAEQEEGEVDLSNYYVYRVHNMNGYMYVVAQNGSDAAAIACKLDPVKFPSNDVADMTVQHQAGAFGPVVIKSMYNDQRKRLRELEGQPSTREFFVSNPWTGNTLSVRARDEDHARQVAIQYRPEWTNGERDLSVTAVRNPRSETNEEYKLYKVSGNSDYEYVAARTPGEAQRIAMIIYSQLGNNLDVVLQDATRTMVSSYQSRQQDALDRMNRLSSSARISDMQSYRVQNVATGESRWVAGSSETDARNRARDQYPEFADAELRATPMN